MSGQNVVEGLQLGTKCIATQKGHLGIWIRFGKLMNLAKLAIYTSETIETIETSETTETCEPVKIISLVKLEAK